MTEIRRLIGLKEQEPLLPLCRPKIIVEDAPVEMSWMKQPMEQQLSDVEEGRICPWLRIEISATVTSPYTPKQTKSVTSRVGGSWFS